MVAMEFADEFGSVWCRCSGVLQARADAADGGMGGGRSSLNWRVVDSHGPFCRLSCCGFVPVWCVILIQGAFETIRFIPSLNVTEAEIALVLERYGKALDDVLPKL